MKMIRKKLILLFLGFYFLLTSEGSIYATYQESGKIKSFGPIGKYASQYSPWVIHEPGWGSYVMYYCKNTVESGVARDRVWRIENWGDGKTGWQNEMIVIDGTLNENDDLSCSPGIVIGNDGIWHMYYVAANRGENAPLYLYHATASHPGTSWTKHGQVQFDRFPQPFPGYLETPSPLLINDQIVLYFVGDGGKLYKAVSDDGFVFSTPQELQAPDFANSGRVTYKDGVYYYLYAIDPTRRYLPPTEIYLATSIDGEHFSEGRLLMRSNGSDWDGGYLWTPHLLIDSPEWRVYYAGNIGKYDWWGANTSIGLRWYRSLTSELTCDYPWAAIPPVTHTLSKETSDVEVNLGFSSTFGGIGVKFELINKQNPTPVDILEARSAAGAGMQYTGMVYPHSGEGGLVNQASGNGLGYQWGYSNNLQVSEANGVATLFSLDWAPDYSDTWGGRGTSPCADSAVSFDEGKPTVTAKLENVSDGSVIHIISSYTLKSLVDQYWKIYVPASGFYLNRAIARQKNLRVYLFGQDGWKEGPIYPYDDFSIMHGDRYDNPGWRLLYQIHPSLKHVLFVWNIKGKDIGILVPDIPFGATIRLADKVYCDDKNNDSCGSIDFGTNDGIPVDVSFPKGQERTYSYDYVVGTVEQLAEYGGFLSPTLWSFDLNNDGQIKVSDVLLLLGNWLKSGVGDLNNDGVVNGLDFGRMIRLIP